MIDRRVLIIEPDDDLAIMIEQFLQASQLGVARARDPEQAKWMAPLIKPQLVMVDYWPSDGVEIAAGFRDDGVLAETPLVMIIPDSLEKKNPDLLVLLKEAYDGFLFKPFADTDLIRVVENFTGFGINMEEEVGGALDQLVDANSSSPELRKAVQDIQNSQSKEKNNSAGQAGEKIAELEAELNDANEKSKEKDAAAVKLQETIDKLEADLEEANEQSQKQTDRISDLMGRLTDMELDHEFAIESLEEENADLKKEAENLNDRVKELEETCEAASKLFGKANKKPQK